MQLFNVRKVSKQLYIVEILCNNLFLRLKKINKFTQISNVSRFFSFKTTKEEEQSENPGENKFVKILKEEGINLNDYLK